MACKLHDRFAICDVPDVPEIVFASGYREGLGGVTRDCEDRLAVSAEATDQVLARFMGSEVSQFVLLRFSVVVLFHGYVSVTWNFGEDIIWVNEVGVLAFLFCDHFLSRHTMNEYGVNGLFLVRAYDFLCEGD